MQVGDTIIIRLVYKRGHGNDILGIVVFDGTQIPEFMLMCGFISNDIRSR